MIDSAAIRREQRVRELRAAAIRAMSGQRAVNLRGGALYREGRPVAMPAPHLHPPADRGAADGMALRLRHNDPAVHAELVPTDTAGRLVFEMLEQFRVESLVPDAWPGVRRNLADLFRAWSERFEASHAVETAAGLLLYTVAQVCRSRITAQPIVDWTQDLIEQTRYELAPEIGRELALLRRNRHCQRSFGVLARAIADRVAAMPQLDGDSDEGDTPWAAFEWLFDAESDDDAAPASEGGPGRTRHPASNGYRVFSRAHDETCNLQTLVRSAALTEYRERLDRAVDASGASPRILGQRLARLFAEPRDDGWEGDHESGFVDGRRLAQLATNPNERNVFVARANTARTDATVSLLVDCSGSMKAFSEPVAVLVDVYARAMELAGVGCEVLGFTTASWNGGRARRDWIRAGRPSNPGRLNDIRHLVIKSADTPYRRARPAIAGLLKLDLYREGVDGEAVEWARGRLHARDEQRRILVVISDGSPMDSATLLGNGPNYLDQHLRDVLATPSEVAVCALGVGPDLGVFYDRCAALDLAAGTTRRVLTDVLETIASTNRGGRYR
ncbi:cobalt chelatase [Mycolicibacterium moriokaense]|nr:cobalt chelatase [Mycolicibacterium moriokaense]